MDMTSHLEHQTLILTHAKNSQHKSTPTAQLRCLPSDLLDTNLWAEEWQRKEGKTLPAWNTYHVIDVKWTSDGCGRKGLLWITILDFIIKHSITRQDPTSTRNREQSTVYKFLVMHCPPYTCLSAMSHDKCFRPSPFFTLSLNAKL